MTKDMKHVMRIGVSAWMVFSCLWADGQTKVDEKRMDQDIEVAENILGTLFRQKYDKRAFFPVEVEGSYMAGYGVTLRLPQDGPFVFMLGAGADPVTWDIRSDGGSYAYSY